MFMRFNDAYGMTEVEFSRRLHEIEIEEKSARRVLYVLEHMKEISEDDIVEARGFYKGIRYARELLRNVCCEYADAYIVANDDDDKEEEDEECDDFEDEEDEDDEEYYCPRNCPFIPVCYTEDCEFDITEEKGDDQDGQSGDT